MPGDDLAGSMSNPVGPGSVGGSPSTSSGDSGRCSEPRRHQGTAPSPRGDPPRIALERHHAVPPATPTPRTVATPRKLKAQPAPRGQPPARRHLRHRLHLFGGPPQRPNWPSMASPSVRLPGQHSGRGFLASPVYGSARWIRLGVLLALARPGTTGLGTCGRRGRESGGQCAGPAVVASALPGSNQDTNNAITTLQLGYTTRPGGMAAADGRGPSVDGGHARVRASTRS